MEKLRHADQPARPGPRAPAYLALAGPTASGKSAAALAIARAHPVEIISVDSALVYRGMDIGTAKPSAPELAEVVHHLVDIRDPLHAFSAAEFVHQAGPLMQQIHERGRLPLLVGGTMLYFKALRDGIDDMPAANPAVRAEIEHSASVRGWAALHAELATVDPVTAARLNPADSQRIQRALEVFRISGLPLSAFHATKNGAGESIAERARDENRLENDSAGALLIALEPTDRSWLHQRIAQRFDAMLEAGFLDEVRGLRARGDLHPELPSMRCVGYRQAWEALDQRWPAGELRERGIAATRQLAKRQLTWLRSMPERLTLPCDAPNALEQVLQAADRFIREARAS